MYNFKIPKPSYIFSQFVEEFGNNSSTPLQCDAATNVVKKYKKTTIHTYHFEK